jgi:D-alanyl-D-alanine carboxypeptidase (penicillin-binding protein 5/6)
MKNKMKKRWTGLLCLCLIFAFAFPTGALAEETKSNTIDLAPNARSALLMDADTGTVIFEKNSHDKLPPASITKIMTMLLIMEALDQGKIKINEMVQTSEYAASMGGSQIFLEAGEEMSVEEMLKGIAMASGNDASVAMAEKIAGSEEMFVQMMNDRAAELGLKNTHFVNTNGLPVNDHYTSAYDIAIMSKELLKYEKITKFTGKYQDYLRKNTDSPFWLVNTNKLVRFYKGADGLKTGYTSEAKFCLAATAKKGNFRVIAVVLGEPNTKIRNAEVTKLFDYAFSQYTNRIIFKTGDTIGALEVEKGMIPSVPLVAKHQYSVLLKKGEDKQNIRHELLIDKDLKAPITHGQPIGKLVVYKDDKVITEFAIEAPVEVPEANWWVLFKRTTSKLFFNR